MYTLTHIHLTHIHTRTHTCTFARHSHTQTALPHTPSPRQPLTVGMSGVEHEGSIRVGGVWGGGRGGEATVWTVGLGEAGCGNLQAFGRRPGLRDD